ncbi:hypothetical protein PTKIN_Ptkin15bG0101800 [Pterospermum kingtungense]
MGCCFSKKIPSSPQPQPAALPVPVSVSSAVAPLAAETTLLKAAGSETKICKVAEEEEEEPLEKTTQEEDHSLVKKEIFVIKHRKSHDREKRSPPTQNAPEDESASSASAEGGGICNINTTVRTSSCTKEEVDAILIQCGRLSRSNSSGTGKTPLSSRKYSGSKRSYDFDHDNENDNDIKVVSTTDRPRHRQSTRSSSQGRRRTPSRERDQRSGSRERGSSSGGGRRVSRSPGRRSENSQGGLSSNAAVNATNRPKMVSVPPTVSALDGVEAATTTTTTTTTGNAIKRISVKRNVGGGEAAVGSRSAASPRSQSPARANSNAKGCNDNQQQPTLNRSSSRKAEHSPYRRNPLSEIDPNSLAYPQSAANKNSSCINKGQATNVINQKSSVEMNHKVSVQGTNHKADGLTTVDNRVVAKEQKMIEDVKIQTPKAETENLKSQPLTRSRSSRRSRDLDLSPEALLNPNPSYTTLLLEDIQNFHQTNNAASSFSLPPCVSKACTILEAVADLNSTTSSKLSSVFSEDRKGLPTDDSNKNGNNNSISIGRRMTEPRDPFVESEVMGSDDLMEPSFHKYVTVRRGGSDMDDQESSGSNSFVGNNGQQLWGFSSSCSREPNSADSTDRWTSTTKSGEEDYSGVRRHGLGESGTNSSRKGLSGRRRDSDLQHTGGKIASKGLHSIPFAATT